MVEIRIDVRSSMSSIFDCRFSFLRRCLMAGASRSARKWKIEEILLAQNLAEDARFELALRF